MKILTAIILLALSASAYAGTAFLKHQYVSGLNRVCVYDHMGSDYILTVKSYELCPMTVQVN